MTKIFIWYDKFSVNNEEIDNQHKALFNIFNMLYKNCVEHESYIFLESLIYELVSYTKYHFSTEEQYMRDTGYKDINKHIEQHKIFTDKILQLKSENFSDDFEKTKELIIYLWNWILNHVMVEDKKITV
jgi:hemerythrin-like metal-binding protein